MGQIIFGEEQKYFYPKIIGDIGIRGPPNLRWIRPLSPSYLTRRQLIDVDMY